MEKLKFLIFLIIVKIGGIQCFNDSNNQKPNGPLILTLYIKNRQIELGKELAAVKHPELVAKGVKSYSGFFTVSEACNSNLFFWFFPAQVNSTISPVVLYLNGGPGQSSLYGALMENGPVSINSNYKLKLRKHSWNENHNVLYIDSPVGTGFSFTNALDCYLTNQEDIGISLHEAILQFFQLFPELRKNSFYITGESYAGKYIPALGHQIISKQNICKPNNCINLKGVAIFNGIIDPKNQLDYGSLLHALNFIDRNNFIKFKKYQSEAAILIAKGEYLEALNTMANIMNWPNCLFFNVSGFSSPHNILRPDGYIDEITVTTDYILNSDLSKYLHVGNIRFVSMFDSFPVLQKLMGDITQSVAHWLVELLENCSDVYICSGMLDILAGPALQRNFLSKLQFSGASDYATAEQQIWIKDNKIAGYFKRAGTLREITVLNAGHMAQIDQPSECHDIVTRLARNGF
ncbi:venom serine carboxypeptidase-like [Bradysia coprophila]|uniref:venom serine carboxypeptidase-like n=1 Tax=Bradysia coprophila TaxID=38358 RepID=UPI00187DC9BF|nr:venom serine carboxypeptidase-like [Bradysia coprophila]